MERVSMEPGTPVKARIGASLTIAPVFRGQERRLLVGIIDDSGQEVAVALTKAEATEIAMSMLDEAEGLS